MAQTAVLHLFRSLFVRVPTVEHRQYLLQHIKVSIRRGTIVRFLLLLKHLLIFWNSDSSFNNTGCKCLHKQSVTLIKDRNISQIIYCEIRILN